jgi:hypothetical protein
MHIIFNFYLKHFWLDVVYLTKDKKRDLEPHVIEFMKTYLHPQ